MHILKNERLKISLKRVIFTFFMRQTWLTRNAKVFRNIGTCDRGEASSSVYTPKT